MKKPRAGFERIQVLWFLTVLAALGVLIGPALYQKAHAEGNIRMKVLLRAFHSSNEAYRQHNPSEGYAKVIADLVQGPKKVKYLAEAWLQPSLEGFTIRYQASEQALTQTFSLSAQRAGLLKSSFCIDQQGVLHSGMTARRQPTEVPLTADAAGCHGGIEVV